MKNNDEKTIQYFSGIIRDYVFAIQSWGSVESLIE